MPGGFRIQMRAYDSKVISGIRNFKIRQLKKSRLAVMTYVREFMREAKRNAPVMTGRLRDSIGNPSKEGILRISPKGLSAQVGTAVPYSTIIEMGATKEWVIAAKKMKYLRFSGATGGQYIFSKRVKHPPIKGKHFMLRASKVAIQKVRTKYAML